MNSSLLFFSEQAFLIATEAMATIALLTFRAWFGQFETQRIQEMHFLLSADFS